MTLAEVNGFALSEFVQRLGGVFEHSPWVAERAWAARPFADLGALHQAMMRAVREARPDAQLALIRAHPELAGREAKEGELTESSSGEQGRLGFTSLTRSGFERIGELNRGYREKFGFPCIVALRLHATRDTVLAEMERRLANDVEAEIAAALGQIAHIARGRLEKLVAC
jgi:chitin deacetylase